MTNQPGRRGTRAAALAVLTAGAVCAGAPAALADKGGRPNDHAAGAPGQARQQPAPPAHAPAHGVRGTRPAQRPKQRARRAPAQPVRARRAPVRPAPPARAQGPKRPKTAPPARAQRSPNPHATAGKVTICHATGSATNPYVEITMSRNALTAHAEIHHDGRDVVPAPAGGCPGAAAKPEVVGTPAPAVLPRSDERRATAPAPQAARGRAGVLGRVERAAGRNGDTAVLGESATESGDAPATAPRVARPAAAAEADEGGLPFTGLDLVVIALAGAAALLAGIALRRRARVQRHDG